MTTWPRVAERVAALFPGDPQLPALVAACEHDDLALAVYLKADLFRHLWTHERSRKIDVRAFLDNDAWPAMAADACLARGLPLPAWCADWLRRVLAGKARAPTEAQRQRAAKALRLWNAMTTPGPAPAEHDDGLRPLPPARGWEAHAKWDANGRLKLAVPEGLASPQGAAADHVGMNEKAARALIAVFREYWDGLA